MLCCLSRTYSGFEAFIRVLNQLKAYLNHPGNRLFALIVGIFILLNCLLIANEVYLLPLLPAALLIILAAVLALDKLVYIILFFVPFSLTVEFSEFAALTVPSEPLLFGVMLIFFFRAIFQGGFDKSIIRHPVSVMILVNLVWMLITSFTSTMPLVSFKYTLVRLWFLTSFYFIASQIFRNPLNMKRWIFIFTIPLSIVIVYSIVQFFNYNVDKNALYWVMQPFFKDHTIYGAVIALMLPLMLMFSFNKSYTPAERFFSFLLFLIILLGIILSYTRAAWVSVFGAFCIYLLYYFRVSKWIFISGVLAAGITAFALSDQIMMKLQRNKQSSSENLAEHLQSVSNVRNDASNLERINRWNSAIRMFADKPVFGFGPGTYKFQYAPYQRSTEMTFASTNAGTLGNAHSEYLGPLAESGLPGSLSFIAIVIATIVTGSRVYYTSTNKKVRGLAIALLIGLCTYFLHGLLNNFLDQDKAAAPFWSMVAMIVALDVYHRKMPEKEYDPTQVMNNSKRI